ncbi:MAG TPA: hypothetical protein VKV24_08150 [Casimicrobiaceae bacterium]|nr:hypothetical protein [Casimicrobiaceae bacterium]
MAAGFVLAAACASPSLDKDAGWHPEKIYRTGSNIPTRDYGAENIEVGKPDVSDSMNRPMGNIAGKKPGG